MSLQLPFQAVMMSHKCNQLVKVHAHQTLALTTIRTSAWHLPTMAFLAFP